MVVLGHWTVQPLAVALVAVLVMHEYGRRRLAGLGGDSRPPRESRRQAWLFRSGLAFGVLIVASPLGYLSHTLLSARAALDLSFACLIPPLIVLGAPWSAFAAGIRFASWRAAGTGRRDRRPVRPAPVGPVVAAVAFSGLLVVWQMPAVLDRSVHSGALWTAQIICYLAAGTLLWLQLTGSHPFQPRWHPVRRAGLLAAALCTTWLSGVALVIATRLWYPAFAGGPGLLTRDMEQGLAGAITCVLPLIPFGIAAFWCFAAWIEQDDDEGRLREVAEPAAASARPYTGNDGAAG